VLNEYEKLLSYLGKRGRVQFAGGEPLLSPNIYDLIKEARNADMAVRILSNGTLIDNNVAKKIKDAGCYIVQISIEGNKKVNDKIRASGSFNMALSGAKALKDNGLEVTFAMTLSKENVSQIKNVFKIAKKHANRIGFHRLVPIGSGKAMQDLMLSKKELYNAFTTILSLKKKNTELDIPLRDPVWRAYFSSCDCTKDEISGCSAGYNGLCIGSNGDVYPCRRLPLKIGNVYKESLIDLWHHDVMKTLRDRKMRQGKCAGCDISNLCGGCPGIAYALSGDYTAEDPQCFK
jgi:radical SAM protein with 4Fe4S-binding SPASM domain